MGAAQRLPLPLLGGTRSRTRTSDASNEGKRADLSSEEKEPGGSAVATRPAETTYRLSEPWPSSEEGTAFTPPSQATSSSYLLAGIWLSSMPT